MIGPVCVVKGVSAAGVLKRAPCVEETPSVSGVVTSVPGCVLPSTPCVNEAPRVREAVCVSETVCVDEAPCVSETPRVSVPTCVSSMVCVKPFEIWSCQRKRSELFEAIGCWYRSSNFSNFGSRSRVCTHREGSTQL